MVWWGVSGRRLPSLRAPPSARVPLSIAISEFHFYFLYADRLVVVGHPGMLLFDPLGKSRRWRGGGEWCPSPPVPHLWGQTLRG